MELEQSIRTSKRVAKTAIVSALSLNKLKRNGCENIGTEDKLQEPIMRSAEHQKEKRHENDIGIRKMRRQIKEKKSDDFVYGNTKAAISLLNELKEKKNIKPSQKLQQAMKHTRKADIINEKVSSRNVTIKLKRNELFSNDSSDRRKLKRNYSSFPEIIVDTAASAQKQHEKADTDTTYAELPLKWNSRKSNNEKKGKSGKIKTKNVKSSNEQEKCLEIDRHMTNVDHKGIGEVTEQKNESKNEDVQGHSPKRSARKAKRKVDEDFEYYECKEVRETLEKSKSDLNKSYMKTNLRKQVKVAIIEINKVESESTSPELTDLESSPVISALKDEPSSDSAEIKCLKCELSFSDRKKYDRHLRELHKTLILCQLCNISFNTKNALKDHMKESHSDTNRESQTQTYKCTYENCSMEFINETEYKKHVNKDHMTMKYQCEYCGVGFKQSSSLKNHKAVHHSSETVKQYKCPYEGCSKAFNHTSNRKRHVDSVHLNLRRFQCQLCDSRFKTSSSLKQHVTVRHTSEEDRECYTCHVCSKTFLRKSSLMLHVTLHTNGGKTYSCSFEGCGKTFRLKSNLNKHEKVHNDIKPYQCDVCIERFSRKIYLQTHMYKHTGVKNYICDICSKSFSQKGNLKTHKLLHNRERTIYKCSKCSQTFNFKSNMKKHYQRHDLDEGSRRNSNTSSGATGTFAETTRSKSSNIVPNTLTTQLNGNLVEMALQSSKIWVTPDILDTLQKDGKAVVLKAKPLSKLISIDPEKLPERESNATAGTITVKSNEIGESRSLISKPAHIIKVANTNEQSLNANVCDSVNSKLDTLNVYNGDSFVQSESYKKKETIKGESISAPLYVRIEGTTPNAIEENSMDEKGFEDNAKSVVKISMLAENPSFTVEFDSNVMPVARLNDT